MKIQRMTVTYMRSAGMKTGRELFKGKTAACTYRMEKYRRAESDEIAAAGD